MNTPGTSATIDPENVDTHAHGSLAEVIFLLRTKERECETYAQIVRMYELEHATLRRWNAKYHEILTARGIPFPASLD